MPITRDTPATMIRVAEIVRTEKKTGFAKRPTCGCTKGWSTSMSVYCPYRSCSSWSELATKNFNISLKRIETRHSTECIHYVSGGSRFPCSLAIAHILGICTSQFLNYLHLPTTHSDPSTLIGLVRRLHQVFHRSFCEGIGELI